MITATHKGNRYEIEYSVVNVSELEGELRIDAEYYEPFYLKNEEKIKNKKWVFLGSNNVTEIITDGDHGNPRYCDKGTPYLTVKEIEETSINFESAQKVCDEYANKLRKHNYININEVLITTVGTIGKVCVVTKDVKAILSRDVAKIKLLRLTIFSPFFLQAYLMSKNAQILLEQISTGGLQQGLYLYQIKQLKIPLLSENFQQQVENLVLEAYEEKEKSVNLYKQAEETLLEELGLKDWKPKTKKIVIGGKEFEEEENISIRNLSEAVKADRLDAEYFQPAYDEIITTLKEKVELKPLEKLIPDIQKDIQKGVEVGSDNYIEEGKPFIRVSNLSISGLTDRDQKYISEELYQQLKLTYGPKEGDFLLTKDATPGIAYVVKDPVEGIISSGILKLKIKEIDKEYLALCINSLIGKMQVERDGGGSVIIHWKPEQIKNLQIPLLPFETQQKLTSLVQQSHEARKKSKELLEVAKRAVEIAIEKNEKEALSYISKTENKQ